MKLSLVILPLLFAGTLSACTIHEGQSKHTKPPTLGAELMQLQKAFERDALSEREYREAKRELLDSRPDYRQGYFSEKPGENQERDHEH